MKGILIRQNGGPETLEYSDIENPKADGANALVRLHSIGINYIDTYQRSGLYKVPLPFTPGQEGAGVIEQVGSDVKGFQSGERVAFVVPPRCYAEYALVPAKDLVRLPEKVSFSDGAAAMLQGMTAHYLTHSTWPLKAGETCLIHAAAGGVGQVLTQIAKLIGARVIGTTSTKEKAETAKAAGADEMILYTEQDFAAEVKKLTNGKGVDVVYDSVGASTFEKSLQCLRPRGMMATFGNASGPAPALEPLKLSQLGSLFLTRPKLSDYTLTPEELAWRAGDVLSWVADGKLKLEIFKEYPLKDAAQAHRDLESRKTKGKLLLRPE